MQLSKHNKHIIRNVSKTKQQKPQRFPDPYRILFFKSLPWPLT